MPSAALPGLAAPASGSWSVEQQLVHLWDSAQVNTLRLLGRWMRMFTIPNQSSVAKAWQEFDEHGRMRASSYYERIVDVMEELVRFTVLLRPHVEALTDRYSERVGGESAAASVKPVMTAAPG